MNRELACTYQLLFQLGLLVPFGPAFGIAKDKRWQAPNTQSSWNFKHRLNFAKALARERKELGPLGRLRRPYRTGFRSCRFWNGYGTARGGCKTGRIPIRTGTERNTARLGN